MTRLRARLRRLRWKLTWSYTWVAALSFLIVETVLLVLLMIVLGFNPLRRDIEVYNEIVAPVLTDDIRPITMAHLRYQPVDSAALQADLEQILGLEPLKTPRSPFEIEQFAFQGPIIKGIFFVGLYPDAFAQVDISDQDGRLPALKVLF